MSDVQELDKKLAQQSDRNARFKFIAGGAVALVLVLLVVVISQLDMTATTTEESAQGLEQSEQHALSNSTTKADDSAANMADNAAVNREQLQQTLADLKVRVSELNSATAKMNWDTARSSTFKTTLDDLYLQYAGGHYAKVEKDAKALNNDLDQYSSDYQQAYENAHQQAQHAFDVNDIDSATLANNDTLAIHPDYAPAQELQIRIQVYPAVMQLLDQLDKAESERDLDAQATAIQQILLLDNARQAIAQKQQKVARLVAERDFANAIKQGREALQQGDFNSAQEFASRAQRIKANRPELTLLKQEIQNALKQNRQQLLAYQINNAINADNWTEVNLLSQQALAEYPNNTQFQSAQRTASQLQQAHDLLQIYLDKPKRLYDKNIKQVAAQDLSDVAHLTASSASFKTKVSLVKEKLAIANTPLPVRFNSDGKTFIRVLRVGEVGETRGREVNLPPGTYEIEGRRKGYKTKIVPIEVLPDQNNQVTIVCDEKV